MEFLDYLVTMVKQDASDLYLTTNAPPTLKIHGKMQTINNRIFKQGEVEAITKKILSKKQLHEFEEELELNIGISYTELGRFRLNFFKQRNEVAIVVRAINLVIPSIEQLGLPVVLKDLIMKKRGLILIVGATSTGKSTTLASMIDHRNSNGSGHIITIEDPIEYVHPNKNCVVNQREVGIDTKSYGEALKNTLRQSPDVILIGEIRAKETMDHAIAFSETGHVCLSTLHANNADQALERVIHFFPKANREQLLLDLSLNLIAIVSQRLIPSIDGKRVAAVEVLLGSPLIKDLIKRGELDLIKETMERSENIGMQTFDADIFRLYEEGLITEEEAIRHADSQNNLKLRISLHKGKSEDDDNGLSLLSKPEDDQKEVAHPGELHVRKKPIEKPRE